MTTTTMTKEPDRVLKALLVTDLVDSTALIDLLGDYYSAQVFERHESLARHLLDEHNGIEIDKTDGFLFLFSRPIDAVRYCLALHDALAAISEELNVKLAARAGVHAGEVILRETPPEFVARGAKRIEVDGLAKPIAARIMALAQGGQTLLTRWAFDLARQAAVGPAEVADDVRWVNHGAYHLKGIDEPQAVFEVGRKGRAPLAPPLNTEKAWRAVAALAESESVWRPSARLSVPGRRGWKLERKIGDGPSGELWLAKETTLVSGEKQTIPGGTSIYGDHPSVSSRRGCAILFSPVHDDRSEGDEAPSWQAVDPLACVVVESGDQQGSYAVLTDKPLRCGRSSSMDFTLIHDPMVSRRHCEICRTEEGYQIQELQTRNGVYVNDLEIKTSQLLHNADKIRIGTTNLAFYDETSMND